jgi:hypothetical protein
MSHGLQRCVAGLVVVCAILPTPLSAQDVTDLKPIAAAKDLSRGENIGPFLMKREGVVIRSAEELVALSSKAKSAKDPAVQKEMEAELAKLLKVDAIDWKKQIVLGVIGPELVSLKSDGKVLMATYVPYTERPARSIPQIPKILVLIDRFEGEVKFLPKK